MATTTHPATSEASAANPPEPTKRRAWRLATAEVVFLAAAVLSPLFYAVVTDHAWEDFFITFRHSRNLCEGKGLVYQAGERVHGFTSPLGVLLPALCYELTGERTYREALWAFRGMSIPVLAAAGLVLLRRQERETGRRGMAWVALATFFVLDVKAVSFSINGMETAFLLLFLAGSLALVAREFPRRWLPMGACWAGLMWSRPDGCVLIATMAVADLLFGPGSWRRRFRELLAAGAVCTALYLPWFAGAWVYYGSPIPNTILAKMHLDERLYEGLGPVARYIETAARVFLPIYHAMGDGQGWPPLLRPWAIVLGVFCAGYWLVPLRDPWGRSCSLVFAVQVLYLSMLNFMFPWYTPSAELVGLVVVARGVPRLVEPIARRLPLARVLAVVPLVAVALVMAVIYALTTVEMEVQATVVEMGNRARLGRWLGRVVQPDETVYLECTGTIGYFSNAHMADWPGLVSPDVVRTAREHGTDFYTTVAPLRPDWVVLRPWEAEEMTRRVPSFASDYELAATFDANPEVYRRTTPALLRPLVPGANLPGIGYLTYDAMFLVFHRQEQTR